MGTPDIDKYPQKEHYSKYKRLLMMILLLTGVFVTLLNETLLNLAFPVLSVEMNVSPSNTQHVLTKRLVNLAVLHNVSTIVVGELKGIRAGKDWGDAGNQKFHAWPFRKIIRLLTYKAVLHGIQVVKVTEKDTSATCPICEKKAKAARVHRGLFLHCGFAFNADVVGASNILQRYLREIGTRTFRAGVGCQD